MVCLIGKYRVFAWFSFWDPPRYGVLRLDPPTGIFEFFKVPYLGAIDPEKSKNIDISNFWAEWYIRLERYIHRGILPSRKTPLTRSSRFSAFHYIKFPLSFFTILKFCN